MDIAEVKEYLGAEWTAVQECIADSLKSDIDLLNQTNRSILANSGKQLRPVLALLTARGCSADGSVSEATVRYAAAAELMHNATLLHDDVADDSDQRRGVPTIRALMGPTVSVLLGDYWLVKAMDLILGDHEADSKVIRIFSKTLSDLAEGELLQLQKAQSGDTVEDDYLRIIYSKTASLFEASCVSATLSVGAPDQTVEAMRSYAVALGRAFQIKDDLLDYDGTESVGKPLGVDILEQKMTMPLLGALVNAGPEEDKRVRALVRDIVGHPEHRDEIVDFVKRNGGMEYALARLDLYVDQAVEALDVLPESFEKELLVKLARYTANREK
ncbi:MAG: polyprenyl synthetase family protein [Bacteroidales bacterium]|nr:polyprenyl synthetase family protein [Bacteroidales bacterium]